MAHDQHFPGHIPAEYLTPEIKEGSLYRKRVFQHQLANALGALDRTQRRSDAVRQRLRGSSRSLLQAIGNAEAMVNAYTTNVSNDSGLGEMTTDEVNEGKTCLTEEITQIKDASKGADELEIDVKSLQSRLKERDDGINVLSQLLGNDDNPQVSQEKLEIVMSGVKNLLATDEDVRKKAAQDVAASIREMQKILAKFTKEKASWIASTKTSEEVFAGKIQRLELKNRELSQSVHTLEQTADEYKALLQQAKSENDDKTQKLVLNSDATKRLETALVEMQAKLVTEATKKEKLRQSVAELDDVKRSLADVKRDNWNMEQNNFRMRNNSRAMNSTLHHQNGTIQRLQSENRFLKISTRKFSQELEGQAQKLRQQYCSPKKNDYRALYKNEENQQSYSTKRSQQELRKNRLERIPESSDEGLPSSLEVTAQIATAHVSETELTSSFTSLSTNSSHQKSQAERVLSDRVEPNTRPNNLTSRRKNSGNSFSTDSSHKKNQAESILSDGVEAKTRLNTCTSSKNSFSAVPISADNSQAILQRKRSRKPKRSSKSMLPIWRQEHPDNVYHVEKIQQKFLLECDRSCCSEGISGSSSPRVFQPYDEYDLLYGEISPQYPQPRLVARPMSESEFMRLAEKAPIPRPETNRSKKHGVAANASQIDEGYASPVKNVSKPNLLHNIPIGHLHSTQLLSSCGSVCVRSGSESGSVSRTSSKRLRAGYDGKCLIKYHGAVFDATAFDLVKMRNFTWKAGISDNQDEMGKFFDFLAQKAQELDDSPVWASKHKLGKSCDWISLKNELC